MKIEYTDLEREKKLRIEAQFALLQAQADRLAAERQALYESILDRAKVKPQKGTQVVFYDDHAEIIEPMTETKGQKKKK